MQFSKMHGLGNDFMVVDAVTQNVFFCFYVRAIIIFLILVFQFHSF